MNKQLITLISVSFCGLTLANQPPSPTDTTNTNIILSREDAAELLPGCSLIKAKAATDAMVPTYNYRCSSDLTFSPPKQVSQCAASNTDPKAMDCLYQKNNTGPSIKLRVNCYEFAAWTKDKNKWTCTINPPSIPDCNFAKNNTLTGFYEYNCSPNTHITGTSVKGKCESGSLDLYKTAYYCLSAEASSDIRVMLKCPGGWSPDPQRPGGFICKTSTRSANPGV